MERFLEKRHDPAATLEKAFATAADVWIVGSMALGEGGIRDVPNEEAIAAYRREHFAKHAIEAAMLERAARSPIRYRTLSPDEIGSLSAA